MQFIQSGMLFVVVPVGLAYLWSNNPISHLQLNAKSKFSDYALVTLLMLVAIPAINYITLLNKQIALPESLSFIENWMRNSETQIEKLTLQLLNVHTIGGLIVNLLLIAVLAGFGEELFFRATLQKLLSSKNLPILGIWLAAFVFSTIHMQFYGFFPRLLLGALFGYLLLWSNNLWLPILAHTINNAVGVVFYYLKFNGYSLPNLDTIGTGDTMPLAAVSLVFSVFLIRKLRRNFLIPNYPKSE
jgi:membrane protease YdiL (CAAX protease family)